MENIFENAYYGKPYMCRNNTIAYYCRYVEETKKHALMVNDPENDFVECLPNGHVYDIEFFDKPILTKDGKEISAYEKFGWNREEMKDFRLDIISEYLD